MVQLAEELWDAILASFLLIDDGELADIVPYTRRGAAVALVSRAFHRISTPHIYHTVVLTTEAVADSFLRTLKDKPSLAAHVKAVALNGAWQAFSEISDYLAGSSIRTISMHVMAFDGSMPGDRFDIPGRGPYLGGCIAVMQPKVVVIVSPTDGRYPRRVGGRVMIMDGVVNYTAQSRAMREMWSWTAAEIVYLNFTVRVRDLARMTVPNQVRVRELWIRVNYTHDELQGLATFMKKDALQRVHLHILPAEASLPTFLPEFFDTLKKDEDLRQRVHVET
ncbi:hypothetical protein EXIGLDRAFT_776943 [Exidia glandulosa HHB12029]|uniref:Uncharacterized protein n=1 Tax=Exidia glandulosa HHB12029 TaxID=1314781 RepID=A0A165D9T8_EXIGL|nr:hypothetical protein EXIGLDRAFT_776943 [Exidia glandulosa HHB12029]